MVKVADMEVGTLLTCSKHGGAVRLTEGMKRMQTRICPECQSKSAVEWAKKNRQQKRESNNAYHHRISNQRSSATARYRKNHPEKRAAHQAVQTAIRNGSLKRFDCEVCGSSASHAHHDDYSQPLNVKWLCHKHHMERHHMLKAREESDR